MATNNSIAKELFFLKKGSASGVIGSETNVSMDSS